MRLILTVLVLSLCSLVSWAGPLTGQDPPSSVLVQRGGYEWAWASPCDGLGMGCGAALIMHHGFALAQATDWARDFVSIQDIYNAFHAGGQRCAAAYFNSGYSHCDSGDVAAGYIQNSPFPGSYYHPNWEAFVVRPTGGGPVVPEPGTWAMLAAGLGLLAMRLKR